MRGAIISMLLFTGLILCNPARAQIESPVKWSYAAKKINNDEAALFLKATIDPGWHIYSTAQKDGGPVKTSFSFVPSGDYTIVGTVSEPKPVSKYETAFGMDVSYFENSVVFRQKIRLNAATTVVKGSLKYMVCNDQKCLPPETVSFAIPIN
jgi:thiol:disulfide interchange protein DsbD